MRRKLIKKNFFFVRLFYLIWLWTQFVIAGNPWSYYSLDIECTWWRLFQKRGAHTKFDIYIFIGHHWHQQQSIKHKKTVAFYFEVLHLLPPPPSKKLLCMNT